MQTCMHGTICFRLIHANHFICLPCPFHWWMDGRKMWQSTFQHLDAWPFSPLHGFSHPNWLALGFAFSSPSMSCNFSQWLDQFDCHCKNGYVKYHSDVWSCLIVFCTLSHSCFENCFQSTFRKFSIFIRRWMHSFFLENASNTVQLNCQQRCKFAAEIARKRTSKQDFWWTWRQTHLSKSMESKKWHLSVHWKHFIKQKLKLHLFPCECPSALLSALLSALNAISENWPKLCLIFCQQPTPDSIWPGNALYINIQIQCSNLLAYERQFFLTYIFDFSKHFGFEVKCIW